ncbi:unnamed protein product [Pleuronectes platessa]|uniref:Uncharacterized protein n=1 Tax=Pleuronectes platessa TaxID=8262 RepID=A0A9N7TTV0_PLEPL|nr:unnamed protein product [Pleuronectes platessa]
MLLLCSVATQLNTGPVCQLGNPSAVDFTFSQRHQARSCSDLADDHYEQRLFTLPLFELLKTAVNNKGHYRLVFSLLVLLLGPHHIRDKLFLLLSAKMMNQNPEICRVREEMEAMSYSTLDLLMEVVESDVTDSSVSLK